MNEPADGDHPGSPLAPGDGAGDGPAPRSNRKGSRQVIGPFTVRHLVVVNTIIAVVLVILFVAVAPLGSTNLGSPANPQATFYRLSTTTQGLEVGQLAPDFTGKNGDHTVALTDLDGHPISLAALRGHPVWVNFWATWCPPCQHETPDLRAAYLAHQQEGLILVGIDVQEDAETVRNYALHYGLTYTVGLDSTAAIMKTYRVFGLPTHYFIDRNGVIRDRNFGPLARDQIEAKLAEILGP